MKASVNRFVVAASAALSLLAVSGAHAGTVISDHRYWPGEHVSSRINTASSPFDAMASADTVQVGGTAVTYRGGPKTGTRSY